MGLYLRCKLYIGGVEKSLEEELSNITGVCKGLTGCIDDVTIYKGRMQVNTSYENAQVMHRISDCNSKHPCNPSPCHQQADCFVKESTNNTLLVTGSEFSSYCKCDKCHTGEFCEEATHLPDPCLSSPCSSDKICRAKRHNSTFDCLCLDDHDDEIDCFELESQRTMPMFDSSSSIELNLKTLNLYENTIISFVFKPLENNGLLMYNGNDEFFTKISVENGSLKIVSGNNTATHTYTSNKNIKIRLWNDVEIAANKDETIVLVNNEKVDKFENTIQLNKNLPLYIGSVANTNINSQIDIPNFVGTFQKFTINNIDMFDADLMKMTNISTDGGSPCEQQTCRNQATCHPHHGGFHCECLEGFTGPNCDKEMNSSAIYFDGNSPTLHRIDFEESSSFSYKQIKIRFKIKELQRILAKMKLSLDGDDNSSLTLGVTERAQVFVEIQTNNRTKLMHSNNRVKVNDEWNDLHVKAWNNFVVMNLNDDQPVFLSDYNENNAHIMFHNHISIGGDYPNSSRNEFDLHQDFQGCICEFVVGLKKVKLLELRDSRKNNRYELCRNVDLNS